MMEDPDALLASLQRARRALAAQHAVTRVLADTPSLDEAAARLLPVLAEALQARAAELYLGDAEGTRLRPVLRVQDGGPVQVAETVNGVDDADGCADAPTGPVAERVTLEEVQLFPSDSSRLMGVPVLATVVKRWHDHREWTKLVIVGHADERGGTAYNQALAARRAERVRGALVSMGIPAERIEVVSEGNQRPRAVGSDESAWRQNRRVEFVVVRGEQERE
jgi:outer membrane protein OmpA-like peptidoglycan-associated protein